MTSRPREERLVLDGGLATELEARGFDLSDALWSARLLADAPDAIEAVHYDYFVAGADVAITASYQVSYEGFAARGYSPEATDHLLQRSVRLAQAARDRAGREPVVAGRRLLVAASVGPFGASRHDGSEYRGDYGVGEEVLEAFHWPRVAALLAAGPDLLACETVPSLLEARAIVRVLAEHRDARAWVSFTCRDAGHTSAGDPILDCVTLLDAVPQVVAIGVNCVTPEVVTPLVRAMAASTSKPVVMYPNSGERWNAIGRCWEGTGLRFTTYVDEWIEAGAAWVGGCCRTTPVDIAQVRAAVDRHA